MGSAPRLEGKRAPLARQRQELVDVRPGRRPLGGDRRGARLPAPGEPGLLCSVRPPRSCRRPLLRAAHVRPRGHRRDLRRRGPSAACGVEATVHLTGHSTSRVREGNGVREVFTVNLTGIITSEFGSFKVKDVGSDATRITPDGQVIVSIRGQVPFFFKGVLKFDGTTEEPLNDPNFAAASARSSAPAPR